MKNRLAVALASVVLLSGTVVAQDGTQVLPSDNTVALTEETTELFKDTETSSPLDRKVSIRVSNVAIPVFLNSITTQAKVNFIMSDEFANKKVTASLTRVTVREALDTLLRVHGLAYQRIGRSDSYVVTKRSEDAPNTITKIYTLSYISLQGLNSSGGGSGFSGSSSYSGSGSRYGGSSSSNGDSYSANSEITTIIQSMLSPVGKIAVDPRTNKLIITDVPEIFPQVENILAELDVRPPQILIEAQIVEVNKRSGLTLGFEYGVEGALFSMTAPQREMTSEVMHGNRPDGSGKLHGWDWVFPSYAEAHSGGSSSSDDSGEALSKPGILTISGFNMVLKGLLSRGEAKYLGKPKIVTLNNKEAIITTSQDATVGQVISQTGNATEGLTTQSAERKEVGLTLKVTPQVNREGYVTLFVEPSYSDVVSSGFNFSKDTVTRSASTLVRVKNGQTVVIGGLLSSRETESVQKVPLLGEIPVLGWLFTSKGKDKTTTDLVIFITPTILAE